MNRTKERIKKKKQRKNIRKKEKKQYKDRNNKRRYRNSNVIEFFLIKKMKVNSSTAMTKEKLERKGNKKEWEKENVYGQIPFCVVVNI